MKILKLTNDTKENIISEALKVLKNGGVLIYPTETVYGIGVDPTNSEAIKKLLVYKAKREGKPLSIAVDSKKMARNFVKINKTAENLYDNYLPGPITIVSKSLGKVVEGVESEEKTLGVRIPDYQLVCEIITKFGGPITSSSANASNKKRPYSIDDILNNISETQKEIIDLIIDVGKLPENEPSTVVDTTLDDFVILRQGDIKLSEKTRIVSTSPKETRKFGETLVKKYVQYLGYKSIIFAMKGELGSGKTEMTKGIATGLGILDQIKSPTFIIENNYKIEGKEGSYLSQKKIELIHIDVWRLFSGKELKELDFLEQVENSNIFVIEWADKIVDLLKEISSDAVVLWVEIKYGENELEREIVVSDFM